MLASQQDTMDTLWEANGMCQCVSHAAESIGPDRWLFHPLPQETDAVATQETILLTSLDDAWDHTSGTNRIQNQGQVYCPY